MNHNSSLNLVWSLLQGDFAAPDIPKSMAWCENSICVGFKRDYYLIRVSEKEKKKKKNAALIIFSLLCNTDESSSTLASNNTTVAQQGK